MQYWNCPQGGRTLFLILFFFNRCLVNHVGCLLGGERRVHLHSSRWWRCDRVHEESKPCRVFWRLRLCLGSLVYGSTISNQSADNWNNIGNHKLYVFMFHKTKSDYLTGLNYNLRCQALWESDPSWHYLLVYVEISTILKSIILCNVHILTNESSEALESISSIIKINRGIPFAFNVIREVSLILVRSFRCLSVRYR